MRFHPLNTDWVYIGTDLGVFASEDLGLTWSQVALAANAPMLTKAALVDGHPEVGILPTGAGLGVIDGAPTCGQIIDGIVTQASAAFDRLEA